MKKLTAIIIKGNPKFIKNNPEADTFYNEIKLFLENEGYEVSFNDGEPYTQPEPAHLWIGHSRGIDRLRFAPEGTHVIMIGATHKDAINHPEDNSVGLTYPSDVVPNKYHYVFTDEMKKKIEEVTNKIKNKFV